MSSAVRATEVTGIPSISAASSPWKVRERWIARPRRARREIGVVTWIGTAGTDINPQSHAADQWLSNAPAPQPRTAARQRPCSERSVCPTA